MDTTTARLLDSQVKSLLSFGLASPAPHLGELLAEVSHDQRNAILSAALEDLNVPIGDACRGPLGMHRLLTIPAAELESLRSRTFLAAVADPKTSRTSLSALCEYGELLQDEHFPISARLAGAMLSAFAHLALLRFHGVAISPSDSDSVRHALEAIAQSSQIPRDFSEYVNASRLQTP